MTGLLFSTINSQICCSRVVFCWRVRFWAQPLVVQANRGLGRCPDPEGLQPMSTSSPSASRQRAGMAGTRAWATGKRWVRNTKRRGWKLDYNNIRMIIFCGPIMKLLFPFSCVAILKILCNSIITFRIIEGCELYFVNTTCRLWPRIVSPCHGAGMIMTHVLQTASTDMYFKNTATSNMEKVCVCL